VALIVADEPSVAAFGSNPLDPASRAPSAEAGRAQAAAGLDAAAEVWR
jgi:NTE family protein